MWDFSLCTDHEIEARRPDLVVINKRENSCQIIDAAAKEGRARAKKDKKKS